MKTELKSGEALMLVTRPHWFTMVFPVMVLLGALVIGIVIGGYGLFVILAGGLYFLYKAVERKNNIWAVTSMRIIDEFGVFSNNSKESPLDKINNVSYQQTFWGKVFGFGNVQIQTAAEIGSTTYTMVQRPARLKDTITRMQEEYKDNLIRKQAAVMAGAMNPGHGQGRPDVPDELEKLHGLMQRGIITAEEFAARKELLLNSRG
jgi:uncharacterized membrane protein YdbT with pleckstrin-like domain